MSQQFIDSDHQVPLDTDALAAWFTACGQQFDPAATVRQFSGGLANINYLIELDGMPAVLRRPPGGELPRGAHDMVREHRILSRLWRHFELAPRGLHLCEDLDVIGVPFQVNEYRDGRCVRGDNLGQLGALPNAGETLTELMVQTLASIHDVDVAAAGLNDLGKPEGFIQRAVAGWARRGAAFDDRAGKSVAKLTRWLEARVEKLPARKPTLLHSDFKLDNILLRPGTLMPVAVVDWDMGTLGDPLFDLATLLSYWTEPGDPECMHTLAQMPTATDGFGSRADVIERYARLTGRSVDGIDVLRVLGLFKLGVVFLQLHQRWASSGLGDERYASFGELGADLLEFADAVSVGRYV